MNNKGFTLIELLAVIIVLGIVSAITVTTVGGSLSNAKAKSEKVFINNVTKAVDAYVAEEKGKFNWVVNVNKFKKYDETADKCSGDGCNVSVSKATFKLSNVISNGYIKNDEFVNPNNSKKDVNGNDVACYDNNTEVIVYRDNDYVYCFMVKLGCLNKDGKDGVINTCPFTDNSNSFGDYYYTIDLKDDGTVNTNSNNNTSKLGTLTP